MTVIKINAITVDPASGDELAHRFAARAGSVDDQDGFEGFELLKPVDGRPVWLVITRWRDEESFQAWIGPPQGSGHGSGHGHGHGHGDRPPVATGTELWSYEVAGGSPGTGGPGA